MEQTEIPSQEPTPVIITPQFSNFISLSALQTQAENYKEAMNCDDDPDFLYDGMDPEEYCKAHGG